MASRLLPRMMNPLLAVMVLAWACAGSAQAQDSSAPAAEVAQVRAGVAALGRHWNEAVNAETARLYTSIQRAHPPSGIREIRAASYGGKRWQTLDLYYPDQGFDALGPVFIFLHGDAEIDAGRTAGQMSAVLYANAARSLARFGGVGINATYGQSPHAKRPAGADDVHALVAWVRQHSAQYGGDPASIIVLGSGEGATQLATYLFHQPSQMKEGPGIAGAILGAGRFDQANLNLVDTYDGKAVPLLMWSAEYDPLESGVIEMRDKLCKKYSACPMYVELSGHNHVSPVMSIDSLDVSVAAVIVRFYHTAVRK
ncbi:MAG TPA: alpha/beta hydrolase [Steroidobacteraceae bacterium]|nr:alpha/beta hydrolase [Steroidobacteraceae bacterium]